MRRTRVVGALATVLLALAAIPLGPPAATVAAVDYGNSPELRFREVGCPRNLATDQREPRYRGWGWPLELSPGRRQAVERQRRIERLMRCDLIQIFSLHRQRQLLMSEAEERELDGVLADLVTEAAELYDQWVLEGRLALAPVGCYEAVWALEGYLEREAQLQRLGVTLDDMPLFERLGLPERLWPTIVDRCFDEQYRRCVDTGDFPGLVAFLLAFERQAQLLGREVEAPEYELGKQALERCGRWRLQLDTSYVGRIDGTVELEAGRELHLQWKPGSGAFSLHGSVIEGEGEVDSRKIAHKKRGERCRESAIRPGKPARGELRHSLFEIDKNQWPKPLELELLVNFGTTDYRFRCVDKLAGFETFDSATSLDYQHGRWAVTRVLEESYSEDGVEATLGKTGWQFRQGPYKAIQTWQYEADRRLNRVEAILEHEPG